MRTVRPALTSSTTDSATSITTSRLRVRPPCAPAPVLRPALSASVTSGFDVCSAGTRPNTMPVSSETPSENSEHRHVDRDARLVRHVELGHQRDDRANRAEGEQHAQHAAGEREQDALGQELAQQPAAAGADRHPDGHLARARGAAGQLQVGDVGARDEEQERHRAEQQLQAGPHLSARDRDVQIVPQRGGEALRRKGRRLLLREALVQRAELLLGDGLRHAGRQPHDRIEERQVRARRRQRQPEPFAAIPAEARRHHADDGVRTAVQPQRPADGRRDCPRTAAATAGGSAPRPVRPRRRAGCRVGWIVRPMTGGTPRKLKALPDSRTPLKLSGANSPVISTVSIDVAITSEKAGSSASGSHLVERVAVPAAAVEPANLRGPDLTRPRVGIRRDQHAVDHAEDRRGRADAERQRQQRDQHERRAAPERSHRVAEILSQRVEPASHARLPSEVTH